MDLHANWVQISCSSSFCVYTYLKFIRLFLKFIFSFILPHSSSSVWSLQSASPSHLHDNGIHEVVAFVRILRPLYKHLNSPAKHFWSGNVLDISYNIQQIWEQQRCNALMKACLCGILSYSLYFNHIVKKRKYLQEEKSNFRFDTLYYSNKKDMEVWNRCRVHP